MRNELETLRMESSSGLAAETGKLNADNAELKRITEAGGRLSVERLREREPPLSEKQQKMMEKLATLYRKVRPRCRCRC